MFIRPMRTLALAFGLGLVLSSCSSVNPPMQRFNDMSFRQNPPFQLDVGRVEVVSQYQPPTTPPHIEYDMPVAPENAIKRWVQDRLHPVGRTGTLRVLIRDATATETPLQTDQSVTGVFKKEQAARIDMSIDVAVQMLDDRQFVVAEVAGKAQRSQTTPEDIKLNERDKVLYTMVEDMVKGFDKDIDPDIRSTFARWLGAM